MSDVPIRNRAKEFALALIRESRKWKYDIALSVLLRQVIRAATSIGGNLTEGSAAVSKKEFINYINIARKSAIETAYWLEMLHELVHSSELGRLRRECDEIIKILTAIILKTKRNIQSSSL